MEGRMFYTILGNFLGASVVVIFNLVEFSSFLSWYFFISYSLGVFIGIDCFKFCVECFFCIINIQKSQRLAYGELVGWEKFLIGLFSPFILPFSIIIFVVAMIWILVTVMFYEDKDLNYLGRDSYWT